MAFGTGLASAIVGRSAEVESAVESVAQAVSVNRGDVCTSTDIVYVHAEIADDVIEKLNQRLLSDVTGNPEDPDTIGALGDKLWDEVIEELSVRRGRELRMRGREVVATALDLSDFETACEYPGPIVSVRRFNDIAHLRRLIRRDLELNRTEMSIASSVYTEDKVEARTLMAECRAHSVRWNLPTHTFDPMEPHQGVYIIRQVVDHTVMQADALRS